jgi:hypothetical protein
MLKEVLSPDDCAVCGFCCSFRRQSLNLTPCFAKETLGEIRRLYPEARFRDLPNGAVTIDISDNYRTNDSEEEALCPFNRKGCILPGHLKPFDCELWPFRLMRGEDCLMLALVPTCPHIKKNDGEKLRAAALSAAKAAVKYAETVPEIVIDYRADYEVILRISEDGKIIG